MTEQFVPFEVAIKMKELGFDEKCLTSYNPDGKLMSIWNIGPDEAEGELYLEDTPDELYCRNSTNVNNYIAAPLWSQLFDYINSWTYTHIKGNLVENIDYKHKEKFENHD